MNENLKKTKQVVERKQKHIRENHVHELNDLDKKFEKGLLSKSQWQKARVESLGEFWKKRAEFDEESAQAELAYFNSKEYERGEYRKNLKNASKKMLMIQQILEKCKGFSDKAWLTLRFKDETSWGFELKYFRLRVKESIRVYKKKPGTLTLRDIRSDFVSIDLFKGKPKVIVEEEL